MLYVYGTENPGNTIEVCTRQYGVNLNKQRVTISNIAVKYMYQKGFYLNTGARYCVVDSCDASYNGGLFTSVDSWFYSDRLLFDIQGAHNTIRYCTAIGAGGNGISVAADTTVVEHCLASDSHHGNFDSKYDHRYITYRYNVAEYSLGYVVGPGETANGFYIGDDETGPRHVILEGNIARNVPNSGWVSAGFCLGGSGADSVTIDNNVAYNCWYGMYIHNDTSHAWIRNNIVQQSQNYALRLVNPVGKVLDYNDWYLSGGGMAATGESTFLATLATYRAAHATLDPHSISVDPKFVDAVNGDFQLEDDSPAIGAGIAIPGTSSDFSGKPRRWWANWSQGPFERDFDLTYKMF